MPVASDPPFAVLRKDLPADYCDICEARIRRIDQKQLSVLEGIHADRRAFIIGAGTSLGRIPEDVFDRLATEVTFGVNFLTRWSGLHFRPTYWCVSEENWLLDIERELDSWERSRGYERTPRFFAKNRFRKELDTPPLDDYTRIHVDGDLFVKDGHLGGVMPMRRWGCTHFAFSGYSVVVDCALQLALHMGCSPIYLLGVDCDEWRHIYDDPGINLPERKEDLRLGLIETVTQAARILAAQSPIRALMNATPGGNLTIPRVTLEEALG